MDVGALEADIAKKVQDVGNGTIDPSTDVVALIDRWCASARNITDESKQTEIYRSVSSFIDEFKQNVNDVATAIYHDPFFWYEIRSMIPFTPVESYTVDETRLFCLHPRNIHQTTINQIITKTVRDNVKRHVIAKILELLKSSMPDSVVNQRLKIFKEIEDAQHNMQSLAYVPLCQQREFYEKVDRIDNFVNEQFTGVGIWGSYKTLMWFQDLLDDIVDAIMSSMFRISLESRNVIQNNAKSGADIRLLLTL